jgi:hypothetical protein
MDLTIYKGTKKNRMHNVFNTIFLIKVKNLESPFWCLSMKSTFLNSAGTNDAPVGEKSLFLGWQWQRSGDLRFCIGLADFRFVISYHATT